MIRILKELCALLLVTISSAMSGMIGGITYLWINRFKCFFDTIHQTSPHENNYHMHFNSSENDIHSPTEYTGNLEGCLPTLTLTTLTAIPVGLFLYGTARFLCRSKPRNSSREYQRIANEQSNLPEHGTTESSDKYPQLPDHGTTESFEKYMKKAGRLLYKGDPTAAALPSRKSLPGAIGAATTYNSSDNEDHFDNVPLNDEEQGSTRKSSPP